MKLARVLLGLSGSGLALYGLWCLADPHAGVAGTTGLGLVSAPATVEAMAMYGGLSTGLGVFLLLGALRPAWTVPALGALALTFGALGLARLAGMGLHGPAGVQIFAAAVELVVAALALVSLRRGAALPAGT